MIKLDNGKDDIIVLDDPKPRKRSRPPKQNSPIAKRMHENRCLAQHSSESREHYTPPDVIEACRWLMGSIDTDPCSTALANTIVKADTVYTITNDGLSKQWDGNVYLNPPGGDTAKLRPELKNITRSYPCIWWGYLVHQWLSGSVKQACFMVFQLNLLQAIQKVDIIKMTFFDFPIVFFKERLQFKYPLDTQDGFPIEGTELRDGTGPPGGSALVWLPPIEEYRKEPAEWSRFAEVFSKFGAVLNLNVRGNV